MVPNFQKAKTFSYLDIQIYASVYAEAYTFHHSKFHWENISLGGLFDLNWIDFAPLNGFPIVQKLQKVPFKTKDIDVQTRVSP